MANEFNNDNFQSSMIYRDTSTPQGANPTGANPTGTGSAGTQAGPSYAAGGAPTGTGYAGQGSAYGARPDYRTASSGPRMNGGSNGSSKKNTQPKKQGDSFGVKVGKTAICALVFGTVAGGTIFGINAGAGKMLAKDDVVTVAPNETDDEIEQAFKDKDEKKKESDEAKAQADEELAKAEEEKAEAESEKATGKNSSDKDASDDASSSSSDNDNINTQQIAQSSSTVTLDYDVADIVEKTQPSIVSITTTGTQTIQSYFQVYSQPTAGAGSGIIVGQNDDSLYVATNYHVIENADEIKVGFNDGEVVNATVKGYDEDADIALVLVPLSDMKDTTKDAITIASIGDSSELKVGEPAIAIGNALGYGQSVTVGYISALNRAIEGSDGQYIQTDAAINPGNSGGALINSKGEVIGINSVKYVDSTVEGMGFSIPINEAMSIINDIASGTQAEAINLGIEVVDVGRQYAQIYGFPMGIYVKNVESGSIAENADLHVGDIIVEFDGAEVYTSDDLSKKVRKHNEGDTVEMVVYRADDMGFYNKTTLSVTLSAE
ncbi:PDZ domain-containing protein [Lachnospiraceae bacterium NE2001]|nr:PDZ domain-containing protein [Lachnospiraceae bacterium NE2001]